MTEISVILIEDDSKKIEDIRDFLTKDLLINNLVVKESYQSGIKEIIKTDYDLLLLDMSIPTFDKSPQESGGHYEKFGGYKVLREIVRKNRSLKTILITMFDDFGESDSSITLHQIDESLHRAFPSIYQGSVFYNSKENKWKEDLRHILDKIKND